MAVTLAAGQTVSFQVEAQDADGNPVALDAGLTAASSDDNVVRITIDDSGAGTVTAVAEGAVSVTITDTRPDGATVQLEDSVVVEAAAQNAPPAEQGSVTLVASLTISWGTPA